MGGNNASTTFAGSLSDLNYGGSLSKFGAGMLTLTGVNTYHGTTIVDGGTLQITAGQLNSQNQFIGNSLTGVLTQSGGTNSATSALNLGYNSGSSGTYNLSNSGLLSAYSVNVGYSGTGSFSQSGGTNNTGNSLSLGGNLGSNGSYSLSGNGLLLPTGYVYLGVGGSGLGSFTQTGGTCSNIGQLYLGSNTTGSGTFNLSGSGLFSAGEEWIGYSGTGNFSQSGGTNNVTIILQLGGNGATGSGTYNLSGSGLLSAPSESIGSIYNSGTGNFTQSGGTNTVSQLTVASGSKYALAGGVLQGNILVNQGIFAGSSTPATLLEGGILDLTSGTWQSLGKLSVSMATNSLLIVPTGFNTSTGFASYGSLGVTHTLGTTLTVAAGQSIVGTDTIADPVVCQGAITASGGPINLFGGIALSGTGSVNLGSGTLTTNNAVSSISGGSLLVANQYLGTSGTASFMQSGGTNSIASNGSYYGYASLYLGYNAGSSGTYSLSGNGLLSAGSAYVGYSGIGSFTQSGGTNSMSAIFLGYNNGSNGTYNLSSGSLSVGTAYVGYSGIGTFTQSGGTSNIGSLVLGDGTYSLSGNGLVTALNANVGYYNGTGGTFAQTGGTNNINSTLDVGSYYDGSTYKLSGSGLLTAQNTNVGYAGAGTFLQSGGTNTISGTLSIGDEGEDIGTYNLSGNALLSTQNSIVGSLSGGGFIQSGGTHSISNSLTLYYGSYSLSGNGLLSALNIYDSSPGTAGFNQTGGTTAVSQLTIYNDSGYVLAGGVLQANQIVNQGTFAGSGTPATLIAGGILDLTSGTWQSLGEISLSMAANSLLIVPARFNTSTGFASYGSLGLTHTLGTTLTVAAGQAVVGLGSISDPVVCQGTIAAPFGNTIDLSGGLTLSGTGSVNLGNGALSTNNAISGVSGGSLLAGTQYLGTSGTASFTQSGGTNSILPITPYSYGLLYLGLYASGSGTYNLSGNGLLLAQQEYVGYSGTGTITQSGGTNNCGSLFLGYNTGASGTYNLTGSGLLSGPGAVVGYSGTGSFTQTGGTNNLSGGLQLGVYSGSGTYSLGGNGLLSAPSEFLGAYYTSGTGSFTQSGGTNNVSGPLGLSIGTYNLSGSGLLSAQSEAVGAIFTQSGGTNNVPQLTIGSGGQYLLGGGALQGNSLANQGIFAGGSTPATLVEGGILDLTSGAWQNLGNINLSMAANSLLILPAGSTPSTVFASFGGSGLVDTLGSTLTVAAGRSIVGTGSIRDPVVCQGTILASGGTISLSGGITLSGTGSVNLGIGNLTTDNATSSISGGSLSSASQYLGYSGTGGFTQSGGTNNITGYGALYLGYNAGSSGTYNLSGNGLLTVSNNAFVGYSGTGSFTQSGGTNNVSITGYSGLYLGYYAGSSGTYNLSGSGLLSAQGENVGLLGTGSFTQSGGTNNIGNDSLSIGTNTGGNGTYNLSGNGLLSAQGENVGNSGTGSFTQSGGTNNIGNTLSLSGGTYSLSGSGLLYVPVLYVQPGSSGPAGFIQSGGTINIGNTLNMYGGSTAYTLSGSGLISAPSAYIGSSATLTQSGGTINLSNTLYLGSGGGIGTYNLSGSGLLSAQNENVGSANAYPYSGSTGNFSQTGGTNAVSQLTIASSGSYTLGGGVLQVNNLASQGTFGGGATPANLLAGGILDLTSGTWQGLGNIHLSMAANSLLIVPSGFNPSTGFASYGSLGLTHTLGTTLVVSAGQAIVGNDSISDPVVCQGMLAAAASGAINLSGPLTLSGTGIVSLGSGSLSTNDSLSGITGGLLSSANHYVGYSGTGIFTQSGGTNSITGYGSLGLGFNSGSSGTYNLSGNGLLSVPNAGVGIAGAGTFTQTGGTNNVGNALELGTGGGTGTYNLSSSGLLSAQEENVANVYSYSSGTGNFSQTGGTNDVFQLAIGSSGRYALGGGVLQVGNLANQGIFAGTGTPATLLAGGILDLTSGTWQSLGNIHLSMAANSLVIVPSEFNPSTSFASYGNLGVTHTLGTPLTVTAGQSIVGDGSISDPVVCQGAIAAPSGGGINLSGPLTLSGTGSVSLGYNYPAGYLTTNDSISSITGGSLSSAGHYVGYSGTGSFTQSGGTNNCGILILGNSPGDSGTYLLSGSGLLLASSEYVGGNGTGTFTQSGGTNSIGGNLYLGIGYGGSGTGTYNLNGGLLVIGGLSSNTGNPTFNFGSGTLRANSSWSLALSPYSPMTLVTSGSNGTFDTNGYTVTLNVPLAGPGGLIVTNSGTLILNAANTFTGGTTINGGAVLQVGSGSGGASIATTAGVVDNGSLVFSHSDLETLSAPISGSGSVTQSGSGVLVLGNANSYSGITTISGGTLQIGNPFALQNTTVVLSSSGGSLNLNGLSATLGGLSGNGNLAIGAGTLSVGSNGSTTTYSGNFSGLGSLYKGGSGLLALTAPIATFGSTTVNGGTLAIAGVSLTAATQTIGQSGTGTFLQSSGINIVSNGLVLAQGSSSSGTYSLNGGLLSIPGITVGSGSAAFNFGGGTLAASAAWSASLAMNLNGFGGNSTIDTTGGNIGLFGPLSGPGGLSKAGPGTLTLGVSNGFSGPTTINQGVLQLGNANASQNSTVFINVDNGLQFSPGIGSFDLGGLAGGNLLMLVDTGSSVVSLSVGGNGASTTFSGALSGSGGLTKVGSGSLTLTGLNTFSGATTANAGTIQLPSGLLSSATQFAGLSGTGSFVQTGGTNDISTCLYVGESLGSNGTYALSGSGLVSAATEYAGFGGVGSFLQTGGTNMVSNVLHVGATSGTGAYTLSGNGLLSTSLATIDSGGVFTQSGGTVNGNIAIAVAPSGSGTYLLSGSGVIGATTLSVGQAGSATFTQSGGMNSASVLYLGQGSGGSGLYNLSGGSLSSASQFIGNLGLGAFVQTGGTNVTSSLNLGGTPVHARMP